MWITITAADIKAKITDDEYAAVTETSLPDGTTSAEVIAEEIASTVSMVRGYCPGERGDGATIPDELKDTALFILRHKVFSRLPGMKALLDDIRVREYTSAERQLVHASNGTLRIAPPETPAASQEQAAVPKIGVVSANPRQNTKKKLGGLF